MFCFSHNFLDPIYDMKYPVLGKGKALGLLPPRDEEDEVSPIHAVNFEPMASSPC
jgi:hypothetical protein